MKSKKGELTSKQLITIIILIISFTIMVAFFVMLGLKSMISEESCKNSVMLRGTFSKIPLIGRDLISLKCKTEKICFSMGGECNANTDSTIKVKDNAELVEKMGDLLVDCWWMMGEGKSYYAEKGSCAICSHIYFDEEIKKSSEEISFGDIYENLEERKVPNKNINYLSYLYGSNDPDEVVKRIFEDTKMSLVKMSVNSNEDYIIITSINEEEVHKPPIFSKFEFKLLKDNLGCTNYVMEV